MQPPANDQNAPKLFFKHVLPTQIAGIGYITSIAQDTQGFMWFGGANGLARYDGYDIIIFRHDDSDPKSISHSSINRIAQARDGSLWVATRNGLNLYDSRSRTFTHFTVSSEASTNDITWVHEDRKGGIWLGTRGGLFSFDRRKKIATKIADKTHSNAKNASQVVWSVVDDQDGNIWIAYQAYGVSRYDPDTRKFESFTRDQNLPNAHGFNDTRRLYVDNENRLMAATYGDGLYQFDRDSHQFNKINHDTTEKGATVWSMLVDLNNNLWVGDGSHVHLRPARDEKFYRYFYNDLDVASPGNYVVNEIFEDRAGDIWFGYFPSGIDVVDRQASAFNNYGYSSTNSNSITDGGVSSIAEDVTGNLWIGTGYGLNYLNRTTNQITRFSHDASNPKGLSGSTILSIAKSFDDNIWLGIWSGGLNWLNTKTREFKHYLPDVNNPHSLRGREVWSVIEDHEKNVWSATEEGLNKLDPKTQEFEFFMPPPEFLDGDKVLYSRVVYEDSKNNLWVGSIRGLFLFDRDKKQFTRYKHEAADPTSISADFVLVVYEDRRGNLWVGTEGGGINLLDRATGKFTAFTIKDGLADNVVGGITEDEDGNLWLGTQKGIAHFDTQKRSFRNYDKHHGLADNLFNRNAAQVTRQGEIIMGHSKGFTLFKAADIKSNTYAPNVVLTNLMIGNKPVAIGAEKSPLTKAIDATSSITLSHKDAVLSLEFAALSFHHVEDNQYAYRLLGFEENWNFVGTKRSATYTNLNPGTYVFEVKGANNDGVWSLYPVSLQIDILPPYWRTWWAYTIYALLLLALAYWFFHVHRLKLSFQAEKLEQERVVVKRLKQIDKLKDEFLANTSHELRTPLNGIIGLAESLREGVAGDVSPKMKYHLSLIVDSGKRLASLVNDILDFAQLKNKGLTLNRKSIDIKVLVDVVLTLSKPLVANKAVVFANNIPKNLPSAYADEDRVLQILHNLIGNAAKFTDRGVINVSASVKDDFLQVEVGDTGTGIPADRVGEIFESFTQLEGGIERAQGGAGLGLSVTKQLVELHGGSIRVESVLGIGSTFYFTLPMSYDLPEKINSKYAHATSADKDVSYYAASVVAQDKQPHKNNILIVDDDLINRQVLANYLAIDGYNIIEASCAEDAFKIIETEAVDLVLLDIMMPRISGYEACRLLRETYPAHELPIILLTARSQMNDLVMGFEAGANDFMVKPIVRETLIVRVATHLQLHDVMRNMDKKVAERTEELNRSNAVLKKAQNDLEIAYQKLEEASLTDPLTGLNNRRFLTESIVADIALVERNYQDWLGTLANASPPSQPLKEQDLVFMLLDIDFFKAVNDTYGHNSGDKLLEQFSQILKTTLRESDYLVRWGGEEFLIVIRYCTREEVTELAERIRQKVESFSFDIGNGQRINKTCSIGMAAYPFYRTNPAAMTWEQVIDTADRALYLAKNHGRNCWVNVLAANPAESGVVNPAVCDSLISLAAAGVISIEASVTI
ncbi:diguanylate cyclase domain-containing protein [Cellvibrio zantedeschiae]|uniref:diguanylate cyclase domain-containing protein n=1 Tax=Cellvibrio zantedeschiae TaxID=1237077 RepID=UPI0016753C3A|nr:diguanylate cyclase [Cellvibrio zantedeschiae]